MDIKVFELVKRFDSGEIRLPLMQRDYVWKPKKVVRLLDSLYRNWPIGSFYVWQTHDSHPSKARYGGAIPTRKLDGFCGFLLDGQQRLTSLSLALQSEAEGELQHRAFFDVVNEQFFLGNMKRSITKRVEADDPTLIPLSDLVALSQDPSEHLPAIESAIQALRDKAMLGKNNKHEGSYRQRLHKLANMLNRNALCEEFTDDHEEDAFELFSRLNKGGTSLSTGDVEAARLASAATKKIVEPMRQVVAEKEMKGLGINFVFLVRCLVTVHRGNCRFTELPRNWAADTGEVEQSWKSTERALRAAVAFVRKEMGWTSRRWLPSTMALIPITFMFSKAGHHNLSSEDKDLLRRYLLITGLRSLFRGSTETTVNSYINAVRKTEGSLSEMAAALFERIPKNRLFKIRKEDIASTSGMYSPLMQVYLSWLYYSGAKSWPSGRALSEVVAESLPNDPLGVHHIFPKKFMVDRDYPIDRLNTAANYAILSQADNAELGDRDPFDVWKTLKTQQQQWASQQLFFIANQNLLRSEAYEEFIEVRSQKMAEKLNSFLGLGTSNGVMTANA